MGALLGQLINCLPSDNLITKELIECRRKGKLLDLKTSLDYIRRIASSRQFKVVRLGADGLDELLPEHRAAFLMSLGKLSTLSNVRFLFFGRDNSGIQTEVGNLFDNDDWYVCEEITGERTVEDRRLFLEECLCRSKDWKFLDNDTKAKVFSQLAGPESTLVLLCTIHINC
jgi:hypothetical protein